ncbi:MAG TPA: amidohydrolase family protein [Gemmatimonadales bacterium]|nr:amidohydrolase family protein [Gemmatimonadales bacterium]
MLLDANVFLGGYPYRRVPGTSPAAVLGDMDRIGADSAWVTHLPGIFWRDPTEGNPWLLDVCREMPRLRPALAVHPGLPRWEAVLAEAAATRAPAVRADPTYYGIDPAGAAMRRLVAACAEAGIPLVLAVRLEDPRQRHPLDRAPELPAAAVRALLRSHARARLLVTHAGRGFIEEVHFGSTPEEAARIWWDICWIWGPPEDHLELLLSTMGAERFVFGTGMPLRIPETSVAKLDLLDLAPERRALIEHANLERLAAG